MNHRRGDDMSHYPIADLSLARRLERAEGCANAAAVVAHALHDSDCRGEWTEIGGVFAMFDGVGSPLTQTFGLGVFDILSDGQLDKLERFFLDRGSPVFHEVSPLMEPTLLGRLTARGYHPIELSNVLIRPTMASAPTAAAAEGSTTDLSVRTVKENEVDLWAKIAGRGWATESQEAADFMEQFGRIMGRAAGVTCFLVDRSQPIAAAALSRQGDVALLAGASTLPEARKRGAQRKLLEERLRFAASQGATLAMIATLPGSGSQRNAERSGFRVAYTRTKWQLDPRG